MMGINGTDDELGMSGTLEETVGISGGMMDGVTEFGSGSILVTTEANGVTALGATGLVIDGTVGLVNWGTGLVNWGTVGLVNWGT